MGSNISTLAAACRAGFSLLTGAVAVGCAGAGPTGPQAPSPVRVEAFLDTLENRTFEFFWERTNSATGLVPDRWPSPSFSSIAAVGFGLTAYPIGVDRGLVSRAEAADRVLTTLRFFYQLPQGTTSTGVGGYRGFFYHFLDMSSGFRYQNVELSTIDTSLLMAGVLFCQQYFDGGGSTEAAIRAYADSLYLRIDWTWAQPRPPLITMGWTPEGGFHALDWHGYNEAMLVYLLALGSPTHPIAPEAWGAWTSTYTWGQYFGQSYVGFAPLFGHQYTATWVDFRGIADPYMRSHGIDYFENSRRATLAQRGYATANPAGWSDYGPDIWGLSASDGPADLTLPVDGTQRRFFTYAARGASYTEVRDDGTIAPTAAGGSIAFAPELAGPALVAMRERYGDDVFSQYGMVDAFNPTWKWTTPPASQGKVVAGKGWFDTDYLGIDQGPILAMIANRRSELVWKYMRKSPYIVQGLRRAGFQGGWLDQAP